MSSGFTVYYTILTPVQLSYYLPVVWGICCAKSNEVALFWSIRQRKRFNLLSLIMFCEDTYFNFVNLHSKYTNVYHVYMLHKRIVRIVSSLGPKSSCRNLLKELDVLPPSCQYILPLKMFALDNQKNFQTNFSVHGFVFAYC